MFALWQAKRHSWMEEHFPDRADELRDNWSWVEDAITEVEDVDIDWEDEAGGQAVAIENAVSEVIAAIEEPIAAPRVLPPLEDLIGRVEQRPRGREVVGAIRGRDLYLQLSREKPAAQPYITFADIQQAYRQGVLAQAEYTAVLRYVGELLDKTGIGEFDRFFGHETTVNDIQELYVQAMLPVSWKERWLEALRQSQILRESLGRTKSGRPYTPSPWR